MEKRLNLFARLLKVDEMKREVSGAATAEMVDKEGEIFDYATSKPFFQEWSDEISKATNGKSLGNVREMHEPSAVGKLTAINFADKTKEILVVAKIIDDTAWKKCMEGVYTGFSIGGKYENAWKDGEYVRFTAKPYEISVVDNPAVPGAHFTAVKADGTVQVRKFASGLQKDLGTVSNLAYILQSACYIQTDVFFEAEYEQDGSKLPEELKQWVKDGAAILARMTEEELNELVSAMKTTHDRLGKEGKQTVEIFMSKAGARHSAETKKHHAAIAGAVDKCMKLMGDAKEHCDALMGSDKESSAPIEVTKQVPPEVEAKIEPQESNMALEKNELEKLDSAKADSASALSKVAEVEKGVAALKTEVNEGIAGIHEVLNKMVKAMAAQSGVDTTQTVARTAVPPPVAITKSQENGGTPPAAEVPELTPDEIKKLSPADQEKRYRETAKAALRHPVQDQRLPEYLRG